MPFPHRASHYLQIETIALIAFPPEKKKIHPVLSNRYSFIALFPKKKKKKILDRPSKTEIRFYTYVYTACLACKLPNHTQSWRQPRLETQISRAGGTHLSLPPSLSLSLSPLKCSTMRFRVLHYN